MNAQQAPGVPAYAPNADPDTQPDEPTQQTQQDSQESSQPGADDHLWGYLRPHNPRLARVDFWKIQSRYRLGRRANDNDLVFPGTKISQNHAIIHWDGNEGRKSTVTVTDLSSNGTYVAGTKIGKNQTAILKDGVEICFGSPLPQTRNEGLEDYRFTFRNLTVRPDTRGLHAFYDIDGEIGSGSFATVKRAMHRATGTWYAVKVIQRKHREHSQKDLFVRECAVMEQLKHPNIVEMKDTFFEDDGGINIVMELMSGGDLLKYILDSGGLTEWGTQQIAYQISDALAYIHTLGIAHRDLKPENVLLTNDNPPKAKVADFGLAKIVDSLTMLKTMCGTPSYLAPEVVINGEAGYSVLVDSWSVGVIIFSALTNSSPFLEDSTMELRQRIMTRQVDWQQLQEVPQHQDGGISPLCQRFINELLQFDPANRLSMQNAPRHEWFDPRNGFEPTYGWAHDHLADAPQPSQSQSAYEFSQDPSQPAAAAAGSAPGVSPDVSMLTAGAGGQASTTEGGADGEVAEAAETDAEGEGGGEEGEGEQANGGDDGDTAEADAVMAGASTATVLGAAGPSSGAGARKRAYAELDEDTVMASPVKRGRTAEEDASEAPDAEPERAGPSDPLEMAAPAARTRRPRKAAP
ncbi:kinase-like domain-containing protein [Schizophyllum fasciatum]